MKLSIGVIALALLAAAPAPAQNAVGFSPDVTKDLGSGPSLVVNDHQVAHQTAAGAVTGFLLPPGTLPANVEIAGYHLLANGNTLLVMDTTTALPGLPAASPAEPRDVVEYAPATGLFSVFSDGAAAGIPVGTHIDAIYQPDPIPVGPDSIFSVSTTVTLPGLGAVDDEDLVSYSAGVFTMVFDGSAAGVASALDVDAIHGVTGPAGWLLSFDTSGTVGGVTFDDEDVLRYDSGLGTYAMYMDASLGDPDWFSSDLVALPEPGALASLAAGAALLAGCRSRRGRDSAA
jgi:predicted small secreted protein